MDPDFTTTKNVRKTEWPAPPGCPLRSGLRRVFRERIVPGEF